MKKLIYIAILFYPLVLSAVEKTKEEKVAKYIIENIQKDYVSCYSFYKVSAETFKKVGKEKYIIEGLESLSDATEDEDDYLDKAWGLQPNSRLSCQTVLDDNSLILKRYE